MEVETHTIPSFDLTSTTRPFCTQPGSSESLENDVLLSPIKGDNLKCDDESFCEWNSESAAMKVQKYYRGYRTRRLLADTAVAAEEFWYHHLVSCSFRIIGYLVYSYMNNLVMKNKLAYVELIISPGVR